LEQTEQAPSPGTSSFLAFIAAIFVRGGRQRAARQGQNQEAAPGEGRGAHEEATLVV